MSLLGDLAGQALGGALSGSGGGRGGLMAAALQLLNNRPGGIAGLAQSFSQNGLADMMQSWIGTGANAPVSPEQIENVLGSDAVNEFAQKAGVSPDAASGHLADLLPLLIDKLTPNGHAPEGGTDLVALGMNYLGGK